MISEKDVEYIAALSRIHLRQDEVDALKNDLEKILHYIGKLEKLDVSQIEATSHVLPLKNVYREDDIKPSLDQQDVMKISIDHHQGSFKVPKVIE